MKEMSKNRMFGLGAWGVMSSSSSGKKGGVSDEDLQAQGWLPACLTALLAQVDTGSQQAIATFGKRHLHLSSLYTLSAHRGLIVKRDTVLETAQYLPFHCPKLLLVKPTQGKESMWCSPSCQTQQKCL